MSNFIKRKLLSLRVRIILIKNKLLLRYKNLPKIILVTFGGMLWGSFLQVCFLPRINIGALTLTFLIACLLGYRFQWYETHSQKTIILILSILLIISPIIGICVFPFENTITLPNRAREVATMGNLGWIRSSIATYYKENKIYPITLDKRSNLIGTLTIPAFIPNYVERIPKVYLCKKYPHDDSDTIFIVNTISNQKIQPHQITDKGGWIYSPNSGDIRINCNHKDSKGVPYYEW